MFKKFLIVFLLFSMIITGFPAFSGSFVEAENEDLLPLEKSPSFEGTPLELPDLPSLPLEPSPNPPLEGVEPQFLLSRETEPQSPLSVPEPEDLPSEPMGDKTKLPLEDKTNLEGLNERLEQSPPPP